jgi:hypothetical protein
MKFRLSSSWRIGPWIAPADTVIDYSKSDEWSRRAKGKTIPFDAICLDQQAWEEQLKAYWEHRHLLRGGWA